VKPPARPWSTPLLTENFGVDAAAIRVAIDAAEKRAAVNERKRASRARLDSGIRIHRVRVPAEAVMGLVEAGFLPPNDAEKDDAVAVAVAAFLLARAGGHT